VTDLCSDPNRARDNWRRKAGVIPSKIKGGGTWTPKNKKSLGYEELHKKLIYADGSEKGRGVS